MLLENLRPLRWSHLSLLELCVPIVVRGERLVNASVLTSRTRHEQLSCRGVQPLQDLRNAAHARTCLEQRSANITFTLQERLPTLAKTPVVQPKHDLVGILAEPAVQQSLDLRWNGFLRS